MRGGLTRITPGWILSRRARMARAGVDSVALSSHYVSRARPAPTRPRTTPTNFAETLPALTGRRPALDSEVSAATTRAACPVPPPAHSSPGGRPGSSGRSSRSWALSSPGGFRTESRTSSRPLSATRFRGTSEGSPARVAAPSMPWASPGPRDRHLTRENVCQGYDLAG